MSRNINLFSVSRSFLNIYSHKVSNGLVNNSTRGFSTTRQCSLKTRRSDVANPHIFNVDEFGEPLRKKGNVQSVLDSVGLEGNLVEQLNDMKIGLDSESSGNLQGNKVGANRLPFEDPDSEIMTRPVFVKTDSHFRSRAVQTYNPKPEAAECGWDFPREDEDEIYRLYRQDPIKHNPKSLANDFGIDERTVINTLKVLKAVDDPKDLEEWQCMPKAFRDEYNHNNDWLENEDNSLMGVQDEFDDWMFVPNPYFRQGIGEPIFVSLDDNAPAFRVVSDDEAAKVNEQMIQMNLPTVTHARDEKVKEFVFNKHPDWVDLRSKAIKGKKRMMFMDSSYRRDEARQSTLKTVDMHKRGEKPRKPTEYEVKCFSKTYCSNDAYRHKLKF